LQTLGTDSLGNRLIYDTDFDITWYDSVSSPTNWQNQVNWASALTVNYGSTLFTDWRLPAALEPDSSCSNASSSTGFNCLGSELGHLYYTELDNAANTSFVHRGDFQNFVYDQYWSGTEKDRVDGNAFAFYLTDSQAGWQFYNGEAKGTFSAIAVMDGMAAVAPEPVSSALFIIGGATLGFRRFRKKLVK
jgi:hypothetical protein